MATAAEQWDATFLCTRTAGGLAGCTIVLYPTSLGEKSNSIATFDWFEYKGDDEVFRKASGK